MTVAPVTITEMVASTRFETTRKAVVAELARLLKGITVISHPGKLDMNDVLQKAVVQAPGVAVGFSRLRSTRDLGGTYGVPVDFVAYIITEDFADTRATPPRRIDRDVLAVAIGSQILRILSDPDTATWKLTAISAPMSDPEPEMRPVFTMKAAENAAALFVVTWTQMLVFEGGGFFGGPRPDVHEIPDGLAFDIPDGDIPTELLAVLRGGSQP